MEITFVNLTAGHWPRVQSIYAAGIATGNATFEQAPPTWDDWDARHLAAPRLVALVDGRVVAFAALSPYSGRTVYRGVAEVSVYVAPDVRGRGVGRALLGELVRQADAAGIWTLQAGIFPENRASLALHAACGFRVVGRRERLGQMNGIWRDVMLLERRSEVAGQ